MNMISSMQNDGEMLLLSEYQKELISFPVDPDFRVYILTCKTHRYRLPYCQIYRLFQAVLT